MEDADFEMEDTPAPVAKGKPATKARKDDDEGPEMARPAKKGAAKPSDDGLDDLLDEWADK